MTPADVPHGPDCFRYHHACAIVLVEQQRIALAQAEAGRRVMAGLCWDIIDPDGKLADALQSLR